MNSEPNAIIPDIGKDPEAFKAAVDEIRLSSNPLLALAYQVKLYHECLTQAGFDNQTAAVLASQYQRSVIDRLCAQSGRAEE